MACAEAKENGSYKFLNGLIANKKCHGRLMKSGLQTRTLFELRKTGILGPVTLDGLDHGRVDLSRAQWSYKVELNGEANQVQQPLKWYKAYFDAPAGNEPLALDLKHMVRGQVWINGQSIGRYWTKPANGTCGICKYPGAFRPGKCHTGCGAPTQGWYIFR
ncbi:D-galactoside/L-rhamnose binding SUEL lectin domain-containing protein [Artemisia annua]|uniref:D-galactoside/L-rhamnose binding SUEL lectin domain-containing protein n=1 Tax=Artemisia annua TaxID=35608 RepID=A0A2U1MYM1_ARTAN|nr:D-galactoside/L-rhamnose binding SUEL lectin domain-containing protein [Artemisia annua]